MDNESGKKPELPYVKILIDLAIIALLAVLLFFLAGSMNLAEALLQFLENLEHLQADELIIVIAFLAAALVIVVIQLWRELKTVIREYNRMETSLHRAHTELSFLNSIIRQDVLNGLTELDKELEQAGQKHDVTKLLTVVNRIRRQIKFTKEYQDIGATPPAWQNVADAVMRAKVGVNLGRVTVDVEIQDMEIYADPLLEKAFFYLIDNALKHGGDKLSRIRFHQKMADDGLVIICEDDGVGIPPEKQRYIFPRDIGNRIGYGLFLIREILLVTGITVKSTGISGVGGKFEFHVPKGAFRKA